jgi:hypothetical protein
MAEHGLSRTDEEEVVLNEPAKYQRLRRRGERRSRRGRYLLKRIWLLLWLVFLVAVGVVLLANPFPNVFIDYTSYSPDEMTIDQRLSAVAQTWLAYQKGSEFLGVLVIGGAVVGGWLEVRRWYLATSTMWNHVCPECHYLNIKRIHRRTRDRFLNLVGIPVRRYLCPQCGWAGTRLGSQ